MFRSLPAFALLAVPFAAQAGGITIWQLKETAAAPVIVTGRVVSVDQYDGVPAGSTQWKFETRSMTATVEILRSFSRSGLPLASNQLQIRYLTYSPSVTAIASGPRLPRFATGQVMVFPLQENDHPLTEPFRLIGDQGLGFTIPALPEIENNDDPPSTGRVFVLREIANSLATGTPRDVITVSTYLRDQYEDLTPELMPLLSAAIGGDRERWAEVATGVLATQGIPRPNVADLIAGKTDPQMAARGGVRLARAALLQLKASPETDILLIKTWISNAPVDAWGAAQSLIEYGDHPVTTETLRKALNDDMAGSAYLAWILARNGHQTVLPEALERALRVVDRPTNPDFFTDVQGAAALLGEFGNDQQLRQLANVVRKYQAEDREYYQLLWQFATEVNEPREARVLAVVLRDRSAMGSIRVCDFAAAALERAVGQKFGAGGKTLVERDEAVSRAMAWITANGLAN